jgi:RNA polymerase sigma-70 factor (ECF subfamily)
LTQETKLPGIDGGQHSVLEHRDLLRVCDTSCGTAVGPIFFAVEDLSYEEAARVPGMPIGTVMSRLSRGRERLRRLTGNETHEVP